MKLTQEQLFYLLIVVSLILTRVPYVGKFFRVVNTMIHECGHALMALFLSGEVVKINLFSDTSGVAVTKVSGKIPRMLVSFAGYPFSALMAFIVFWLIKDEYITVALIVLMLFALISLLFFVRNFYGIFWLIVFLVLGGIIVELNSLPVLYAWMVFLASLLLTDEFISGLILLKISIANPTASGDAANLKKETHIPAWIWSLLFCVINGYFVYLTIILTFPPVQNIFKI
ncbi:MAG: M50 family metallopeptidase [Bacteroidota bacterium]|nr:M50 family metallopeptidase [Bacteroidota bacterium]